jgi:hypothetical protein
MEIFALIVIFHVNNVQIKVNLLVKHVINNIHNSYILANAFKFALYDISQILRNNYVNVNYLFLNIKHIYF